MKRRYILIRETHTNEVEIFELKRYYPECTLQVGEVLANGSSIAFMDEYGSYDILNFHGWFPPGEVFNSKIKIMEETTEVGHAVHRL